jgi:hydrogenase maturation protein HypF
MTSIYHQYDHILSCMAENQTPSTVLGVAWDAADIGTHKTIWGGEFLQMTSGGFERVAHFLPYYLPGGELCTLEPRRSAIGLLYSCYGEGAFEMSDLAPMRSFSKPQLIMLRKILTQNNVPVTSSIRRLFDGVAALLNLHYYVSFEGQAALTLEFAATQSPTKLTYPFTITDSYPSLIDWRPMLRAIIEDFRNAVMTPVIAAKFHNTLVEIIVAIAKLTGNRQVVMAGSCFQNSVLIEQAIRRLSAEGFTAYWPQRMPPDNSGIAIGQVLTGWQYLARAEPPVSLTAQRQQTLKSVS